MEAEQIILRTSKIVPAGPIFQWEYAVLELHHVSWGHTQALMKAVEQFVTSGHSQHSDGHLEMTYFREGDNILHLEEFTTHYMRLFIQMVPEWVWYDTEVFLLLPGVMGLDRQNEDGMPIGVSSGN